MDVSETIHRDTLGGFKTLEMKRKDNWGFGVDIAIWQVHAADHNTHVEKSFFAALCISCRD